MDCSFSRNDVAAQTPSTGFLARRPWIRLALIATVLAFTGQALAIPLQDTPASPRKLSGSELLDFERESLRPEYVACMNAAQGDVAVQVGCIDTELAYHDDRLNDVYHKTMAALSSRDKRILRNDERNWIRQIHEGCRVADQSDLSRQLDGKQCLASATIPRARQLADAQYVADRVRAALNPAPKYPEPTPSFDDYGLPDDDGRIDLAIGDIRIQGQMTGCEGAVKIFCNVRSLTVRSRWGEQALEQPELAFLKADRRGLFSVTAYRGNLSDGFVSILPTFLVSDVNRDGHEDLLLWTGTLGSYGDPSYAYYLFDPKTKKFVENPDIAAATKGFTVARIRGNKIDLWYRDGPCLRGDRIVAIRGTRPVEIKRNDYNTCD